MAGSLEAEDKTTPYGTAASSNFAPFISDPTLTGQNTSRILQNRFVSLSSKYVMKYFSRDVTCPTFIWTAPIKVITKASHKNDLFVP